MRWWFSQCCAALLFLFASMKLLTNNKNFTKILYSGPDAILSHKNLPFDPEHLVFDYL
jgi:hypothetical protein